jgi:predicted kinase
MDAATMTIETYDLDIIERAFPYVEAMRNCIQDHVHHAEGDVWTHTRWVLEALSPEWIDDRAMRLTALYHDVRKPETRVVEYDPQQGREAVRHPRHAPLGAAVAWYDLWMAGEALETRLTVYWLCRWHQRVFHIWDDPNMLRSALTFARLSSWSRLIGFARADNLGRICANPQQAVDNLDLLEEFLEEHSGRPICDQSSFWVNEWDRIFYFEKPGRSPWYHAQEPVGSRVTILSGLPGVGKDLHCTTALHGLPVISLDAIRAQLGIEPEDNQGQLRQAAFEQARVYLRERKPFVWNAQTVTRMARDKIIRLCRDYDAYVTIHAFDRPLATILQQNKQRDRQVPQSVILAAARKWEPPSDLEAHQVQWIP